VKYKVRAAAERDLDEAACWYRESATDPRTPLRFLLEVRATFELIAESPGAFAEIHGDIRRCRRTGLPGLLGLLSHPGGRRGRYGRIPRSPPAFGLEAAPVTNQRRREIQLAPQPLTQRRRSYKCDARNSVVAKRASYWSAARREVPVVDRVSGGASRIGGAPWVFALLAPPCCGLFPLRFAWKKTAVPNAERVSLATQRGPRG
jgi:plasmid stabilization system protein ParE